MVIGDARRGIALGITFVNVVAGVVEEDAEAGLGTASLGQAAGRRVVVVAAKIAQARQTEQSQPMPVPMIVPS